MIRKLAHLNFVTNDLEKIIDFYVNKLGMDHSCQAWIADPDGNAIELMEYGYSSLQLSGS